MVSTPPTPSRYHTDTAARSPKHKDHACAIHRPCVIFSHRVHFAQARDISLYPHKNPPNDLRLSEAESHKRINLPL